MFNSKLFKLFFFLQLFCLTITALAEEKIISYDVYIKVLPDSTLEIREQIDVIAEGQKIRRGIFRDFPTIYKDARGLKYKVGFEVVAVYRDGTKEDYHIEHQANGIRVYLGNKNRFLDYGKHTYQLSFKTNRQLGFFENHDELYFNAIGHGWDFEIERANIYVELPSNISKQDIRLDGFTGRMGSTRKNFRITNYSPITFSTTASLSNKEGFTIVVGWPKGFVKEPSRNDKLLWLIKDSLTGIIAVLLSIASILINLYFWLTHGVDPKKGVIYPRFAPPKDFAPYDLPFIISMGYTAKCLSSAIVSMSVKGHTLVREESGLLGFGATFHIDKAANARAELDQAEKSIFSALFGNTNTIKCSSTNHTEFEAAKNLLTKFCESKLGKYYKRNLGYALPGFVLNIVSCAMAFSYGYDFLSAAVVIITILSTVIFLLIIKRYSTEGRALLDEIEGYKMYLDTAEKGHYDNIQFPQLTQERFESHLPYAVALGVEANWMSAFRKALTFAKQNPDNYHPHYYLGNRPFSESKFISDGSSAFSSTIASSSTPPGSGSSGFSGGSSGGGGGGGGGGGW